MGALADLGSCPGGTPGATCPNPTSARPTASPDALATAVGVDVGGLVDAGRAYVLDGATGAVLKRLDMPPADLAEQTAAPGGAARPAFGRAILSPASRFGPTAPDLSGPGTPPVGVRIGDINGGGRPDIVVGAPDYTETAATAHPASPCAAAAGSQCAQAGRAYVYFGESIAGTSPAAIDNAPNVTDQEHRRPARRPRLAGQRQPRELRRHPRARRRHRPLHRRAGPRQRVRERLEHGHRRRPARPRDRRPAGDDFGMDDVGQAMLVDGATDPSSSPTRTRSPQPAALFGFGNDDQPAVGDLGGSTAPDVYLGAIRQDNPRPAAARATR